MSMAMSFQAGRAFREGWKGFNHNALVLVGFTELAAVVLRFCRRFSMAWQPLPSATPVLMLVLQ